MPVLLDTLVLLIENIENFYRKSKICYCTLVDIYKRREYAVVLQNYYFASAELTSKS